MSNYADLAQTEEQRFRKSQVGGSIPPVGSRGDGEMPRVAGVSGDVVRGVTPAAAGGGGAPEAVGPAADDGAPLPSTGGERRQEVLCSVCGRPLRSAKSIARGMGRDCWRKSRRGK